MYTGRTLIFRRALRTLISVLNLLFDSEVFLLMIDFENETPIKASRLATKIGARAVTVNRWILRGLKVRGRKGRVKLEGERIGARYVTTLEAFERFRRATNPDHETPTIRSPRARKSADDEAGRRLEKLGI